MSFIITHPELYCLSNSILIRNLNSDLILSFEQIWLITASKFALKF